MQFAPFSKAGHLYSPFLLIYFTDCKERKEMSSYEEHTISVHLYFLSFYTVCNSVRMVSIIFKLKFEFIGWAGCNYLCLWTQLIVFVPDYLYVYENTVPFRVFEDYWEDSSDIDKRGECLFEHALL